MYAMKTEWRINITFLLQAQLTYTILHKREYAILDGHDNVSVILKFPTKRLSTYMLFSHQEFLLDSSSPFS